MRALVCHEPSGIDSLRLEDLPTQPLTSGSIRVRVSFAAINPPDYLMARGKYQVSPKTPFVIGVEGAGTVVEAAADVTSVRPGQRVMIYPGHGCFAEEIVMPAARAHAVPGGMSDDVASGFLLAYGTSDHGLLTRGRLKAGETLVVLGAGGGLGASATQIGKAVGATVIAVASSEEKLAFCRRNGADHCINAKTDPIRDRLRELTGGRGADVVYDVVGGDLTEIFLRAVAPGGRFLIVGYASGTIPLIKANLVLLKQAEVIGVSYRQYFEQHPRQASADLDRLCELFDSGKLNPARPEVVPFESGISAMHAVAEGRAVGKIAVRVN